MAKKFTFLFLNLVKIHICIPKSTDGGGGPNGLGNIPNENNFFFECFPNRLNDNTRYSGTAKFM